MTKPPSRKSILTTGVEIELPHFLASRGAQVHLVAPQASLDELRLRAPKAGWTGSTTAADVSAAAKRVIVLDPKDEPAMVAAVQAARPDLPVFGVQSHVVPALLTERQLFNIAKLETQPVPIRYAVVCTPRTGSTLLCDLLAAHGLGQPKEHLRSPLVIALRSTGADRRAILRRVMHLGAVDGIFGTKLISHFLADFAGPDGVGAALQQLVDAGFRLIHLDRDPIDQAVSRYVASNSGVWHSRGELNERQRERIEAIGSDPEIMRECLSRVAIEAGIVQRALAGIDPAQVLQVHYEQLSQDHLGTVQACAGHIGVAAPTRNVDSASLPSRLSEQVETHDRLRAEFVALQAHLATAP